MTKDEWIEQVAWDVGFILKQYRGKVIERKEYILDIQHQLPTKVHKALTQECLEDHTLNPLSVLKLWVELHPNIVPTFEEYEDDDDND